MEFQRRDLLKTLQLEGDVVPLNPLPGRCPGPDPQKILGFGYPLLEALIFKCVVPCVGFGGKINIKLQLKFENLFMNARKYELP